MASTKIDGRNIRIYVDTYPVACAQSGTFTINKDMIDVTCKDSSGNYEVIPGQVSWEGSCDGVIDFSSTFGYNEAATKLLAGTAVTLKWSTEVSGDVEFTGSAYLTSVEASGGTNEAATLSISFQGTGALTQQTVS